MKTTITFVAMLVLAAGSLYAVAAEQNSPPPTPPQEQPEVLTRGPVHEAFAEPVNLQVQEGLVAPIQPPANIDEIPPAERPQGVNCVWVPGYWSWDADRNNYIWVSACWRVTPPNTYWVPGYWAQVADGWEWVAGFWAPTGTQEIEYLPPPPVVEYVQPPTPTVPDSIWVPPCWYWNQNQYIQRPGYWLTAQPDWIWVPSHYIWTPRGYVFVAGHWDYSLERRGVLFSPVYFPQSVYGRAGFSYSPSIVINIGALSLSLFTYPRYNHYYFGDYYDDAYLRIGIYPWFESERFHTWYDPIYEHDRWHYLQTEPRWEERQRHEYDLCRADVNRRPARTYYEMETRLARLPEPQRRNFQTAQPLTAFVADKANHVKFEHINAKSQRNIATQATAVRKFREDRSRWESPATSPEKGQPPTERKGSVTPPTEQKPVTATPEHKGPVTPPTEQKPVTAPAEHKGPETLPAEHKEQVTPPSQTKAPFVPPREVHITQPERVKVPAPPIVGKQDAAKKGPPPRPDNERKDKGEGKDTPNKGEPNKGEVKDTPNKGEGKDTPNKDEGNRKQKKNRD